MKFLKNKILSSIVIALIITLIAGIFSNTTFVQNLHLRFSNQLYENRKTSDDITIVGIDQKSLDDTVGLGRFQDWRRTYYATVIENLEKAGAKLIGIDVLFNRRVRGIPEEDVLKILAPLKGKKQYAAQELVDMLQQIVAYVKADGHPDDLVLGESIGMAKNIVMIVYATAKQMPVNGMVEVAMFQDLIDSIARHEPAIGINDAFLDEDSLLRRLPLTFQLGERIEKTFSIAIAEKILGKNILPDIPNENGMLINYSRNREAFRTISFVDAYRNTFDPALVRGKIILIGATAVTMQDNRATPVASVMPGIEIHANAVQTILEKTFLQNQSSAEKTVTLLILGLLVAFITNYLAFKYSAIGVIALMAVYIMAAKYFFTHGTILDMSTPFLQMPVIYIASILYRYFIEYGEKRMLQKAFSHYVSPEVAKQIMQSPETLKLGGEKREITVLFSDIENFTPFSEKHTPEEVVSFMNEYMDALTKVIFKYGGTVDKYEGDAIMAFFGAPITQPDHALRACMCAYEMQETLKRLNLCNTRIGLSTGLAIVGNMGSHDRFEYTAMGDTVNLGARLEPTNKQFGTHILMSERTALAPGVAQQFTLKEFQDVTVKGKTEILKVYTIIGKIQA